MKLVRLEIRNYRSIKEQVGEKAITFDGLDCLVGKNNAGKSNILKAIVFLIGEEKLEEDLYYERDTSREIDVRGYFEVGGSDFERLKIESKKKSLEQCRLDDGTFGICRRSTHTDLEVIGYYPAEPRLTRSQFDAFHEKAWGSQRNGRDFRDRMAQQYPELKSYLREGKEANKGEWPIAYEKFIQDRPDGIEFAQQPGPPPTGISADIRNMLPRLVLVPAVREVTDATKTTKRSELGTLLHELASEVKEELDEAINRAMAEVHRRLNVVTDESTGETLDDRHLGVRAIEARLSLYLSETFRDTAVSLEFPNPESQVMFDNARVWIQEEGFRSVLADSMGEGAKRVLLFSLFRALADFRSGALSVTHDRRHKELTGAQQPLLILYEEAELFLHPGLQIVLLKALESLHNSGDQVIFSTHSPFMLQNAVLTTVNLVTKSAGTGTQVLEFHERIEERNSKEQHRLLEVQNVASYIFADKVVLVEGQSDQLVLQQLAPALNPEWEFERNGIPVLPIFGKGNLPLFREFLNSLGHQTFIVTDLDAIDHIIPRLCGSKEVADCRKNLLQRCQELVKAGAFEAKVNKKHVGKLVSSYAWADVLDGLEELYETLDDGESPCEEHVECLARLLATREMNARRRALLSNDADVAALRLRLAERLLGEDILLLNGDMEDYYPNGTSDKIDSALEFEPAKYSRDQLCSFFTPLSDGNTTDVEAFLGRVFDS